MAASADIFERYLKYLTSLTLATVSDLDQLASEQMYFKDPFHEVRSRQKVKTIFAHVFHVLDQPIFVVKEQVQTEEKLWARWEFGGKVSRLGVTAEILVDGVSIIEQSEHTIISHIDFWDASSDLYAKLPGVGILFKGLGSLFKAC